MSSIYCSSVVHTLQKSLETTKLIEAKFCVESQWDGERSLGHVTKMATMPIYGKNCFKSSSAEPTG